MSTIAPSLLRSIIVASSFRGDDMHRCQAAFLMILLTGIDADAGMLPQEVCMNSQTNEPDPHLAGMACASLCSQKLIESVGRVRSSSPLANGRKVSLWRIAPGKHQTVRTLLSRWGYASPDSPTQLS
jgi:hypothetical protein